MIQQAGWTCDAPSLGRYKATPEKGRCRCDGCRAINTRYARQYDKRTALRIPSRLVPAKDVREHLLWLRSNGLGYRRAAQLSSFSVHPATVRRIVSGKAHRVDRRLEAALLNLSPDQAVGEVVIDAALTTRRLHGLMVNGWSPEELAARLGWDSLDKTRNGSCSVRNARQVAQLTAELDGQIGPQATSDDWEPVGSWDDDYTVLAR